MSITYNGKYEWDLMTKKIIITYRFGSFFRFSRTIMHLTAGEAYAYIGFFMPIPRHVFDYFWDNVETEL